jgi:GTPase SAR1 family protein
MVLVLWDLAGEEEGVVIPQAHFRGSKGVILVADGCRSSSLDAAVDLRKRVTEVAGPLPAVLAVNKVDLYSEWQVDMKTLEAFGRMGLTTFTTSAKTGKAVEDLFLHLTRQMVAVAHIPRDHDHE